MRLSIYQNRSYDRHETDTENNSQEAYHCVYPMVPLIEMGEGDFPWTSKSERLISRAIEGLKRVE